MKSIERRFDELVKKNPYWSTYICFCEAIRNQKFSKKIISRWFYKLVDKDDYFIEDGMKGLMDHLYKLSNPVKKVVISQPSKKVAEEGALQGKIAI